MNFNDIYNHYNIDPAFDDLIKNAENNLRNDFDKLEEISEFNQLKVLKAFNRNNLNTQDFITATILGLTRASSALNISAKIFSTFSRPISA